MKKLLAILILLVLCASVATAESASEGAWYALNEDGTELTVRLEANATTGYQWICTKENDGILELIGEDYVLNETDGVLTGAGGVYVSSFRAADAENGGSRAGETSVTFNYLRTWEENSQIRTAMLLLNVNENGEISVGGELYTDENSETETGFEIEYNEDSTAFTVRLAAQAGNGYEWNCAIENEEMLEMTGSEVIVESGDEPIGGGSLTYEAAFRAPVQTDGSVICGETFITFTYARSWEEGEVPDEVIVCCVEIAEDGTLYVE